MIRVTNGEKFNKTITYLKKAKNLKFKNLLNDYGRRGVDLLSKYTPMNTGLTSESWGYEIQDTKNGAILYWTNSNIQNGVSIALILQYGHGTRNGGYVQGIDYINPALQPLMLNLIADIFKEVERL